MFTLIKICIIISLCPDVLIRFRTVSCDYAIAIMKCQLICLVLLNSVRKREIMNVHFVCLTL